METRLEPAVTTAAPPIQEPVTLQPEPVDSVIHPWFVENMAASCRTTADPVRFVAPGSVTGLPLSIQSFGQSPYHTHFAYGDAHPEMVRTDDCIVCATKVMDVSCTTDRRGKQYLTYGLCPRCGFFQHSLRPPKQFYRDFYRKTWDPTRRTEADWPTQVQLRTTELKATLPYLKEGARVLELGTGWGGSLYAFKRCGFDCYGIEAGEHRAEFVRRTFDIPVHTGECEEVPIGEGFFKPESFDLIISNHVLEHVYNTREVLEHVRPLLKDNGLAYLCIPTYYQENLTCNSHDLSHTCSFSIENFIILLNEIGFELVRDFSDVVNVSVLVRKAPPMPVALRESRLDWLATFMPHRGLAYIMEKNGLSRLPRGFKHDLAMAIVWSHPAYGKPPEPFLKLRFDVPREFAPAIDALRETILARQPIRDVAGLLPIRYVYDSEGVPVWYY